MALELWKVGDWLFTLKCALSCIDIAAKSFLLGSIYLISYIFALIFVYGVDLTEITTLHLNYLLFGISSTVILICLVAKFQFDRVMKFSRLTDPRFYDEPKGRWDD